ncbi:expressed unknown protein [Seminavis robusta]|uniref:Uncharacterized protein n=1 Tax=Seminavis robusta TaxID=568900 RepID=A0A9N8DEE4_9STRA|nr:expressed unknown protein [Seminavis robusta]|eukprot:Sro104_g052650.1 n/a (162) ;mRNA; r:9277-9848
MDNAMVDLVWAQLAELILMLLWPGCVQLVHDEIQNGPGARQPLHRVQTMWDTPPPSAGNQGVGDCTQGRWLECHVRTDNDETSHEESFQLLLEELAKAESTYIFVRKKDEEYIDEAFDADDLDLEDRVGCDSEDSDFEDQDENSDSGDDNDDDMAIFTWKR